MVAKLTLRLPELLAERLRAQSQAAGRSINELAIRVLWRGLGEAEPDEWWRELGDLVEVPPQKGYDPEEVQRRRAELEPGTGSFDEDLDWLRGER